jgi:hypothetical protein
VLARRKISAAESATAAWPEHGYKLYTHDFLRQMPEVKTIDDLMAIRLQPWLKAQGAR